MFLPRSLGSVSIAPLLCLLVVLVSCTTIGVTGQPTVNPGWGRTSPLQPGERANPYCRAAGYVRWWTAEDESNGTIFPLQPDETGSDISIDTASELLCSQVRAGSIGVFGVNFYSTLQGVVRPQASWNGEEFVLAGNGYSTERASGVVTFEPGLNTLSITVEYGASQCQWCQTPNGRVECTPGSCFPCTYTWTKTCRVPEEEVPSSSGGAAPIESSTANMNPIMSSTAAAPSSSATPPVVESSSSLPPPPQSSTATTPAQPSSTATAPVTPSSTATAPVTPSSTAAPPVEPSSSAPPPVQSSTSPPLPTVSSSTGTPAPVAPSSTTPASGGFEISSTAPDTDRSSSASPPIIRLSSSTGSGNNNGVGSSSTSSTPVDPVVPNPPTGGGDSDGNGGTITQPGTDNGNGASACRPSVGILLAAIIAIRALLH